MVFIVDDDEAVRDAIALLMQSDGLRSETFASAREFMESGAIENEHACLVLDLKMPEVGGLELLELIRILNRWLPVIVITSLADSLLAGSALLDDVLAVLPKPFADGILLEHIRNALESRRIPARQ